MLDRGGNLLGILTRNRLISALSEHGATHPADQILESCPDSVTAVTSLAEGLERLRITNCPVMPVLDPMTGLLIGLLTSENVGEVLMIRAALRKDR